MTVNEAIEFLKTIPAEHGDRELLISYDADYGHEGLRPSYTVGADRYFEEAVIWKSTGSPGDK